MENLPESAPQQPITAFLKRKVTYVRDVVHVNVVAQQVTLDSGQFLKERCELSLADNFL